MVGFGRLRVGLGVVGVVAAGLTWIPEGVADSFHLKTGRVVEGVILEANRNTVILRVNGAVVSTSFGQIEQIVLSLADGSELAGELLNWKDGVYEIRSADLPMQIKDGVIIGRNEGNLEVASEKPETEQTDQNESTGAQPSVAIAMQGLPEFTLKSGQAVIGRIIHATGSIVMVRHSGGGVFPTSKAQIESVRFVGDNGEVLSGRFKGWSDDVYQLQDGDTEFLASLSDDAVNVDLPSAAVAAKQSIDESVVSTIESADAAISPVPSISQPTNDNNIASANNVVVEQSGDLDLPDDAELNEASGAGGPASEAAVAALASESTTSLAPAIATTETETAAAAAGPYLVEPTVADVNEDGEAVVFEFRLKEPAVRPLVILYAATDDTARAGQDFEAKSGVITFSTGSQYAEVRVPLIDDEQSETNEQFHLFLSGDPETIQFSQRQIPATISDND